MQHIQEPNNIGTTETVNTEGNTTKCAHSKAERILFTLIAIRSIEKKNL